uniref:12S seed storage globulin 1 n=1 Tax=Anthurium amnicola TaxID=1678845 RepID=A0A1D1Z4M2_9ARAE
MGSAERAVEIDFLERRLLLSSSDGGSGGGGNGSSGEGDEEAVLYTASFEEMEDNFVRYQTAQWVLYSLLLILAWGIGLLMLLYVPVRRYVLRRDFRSRRLYLTPNAIVYKVTKPAPFPFLGVLKKEKYVLLPSVADVTIEQGYLQSYFGVYSIRIENAGVQRPASDDVKIQGVSNPRAFRKAVLTRLSIMKSGSFNRQVSMQEDLPSFQWGYSPAMGMPPSRSFRNALLQSGDQIMQKLEEIGSSVKRVQNLIEKRQSHTSKPLL